MSMDVEHGARQLAELAQEMFDVLRELGMQTMVIDEEEMPHGQTPFRIVIFNHESRTEAKPGFEAPFPTH